jgi:hypothetical protein
VAGALLTVPLGLVTALGQLAAVTLVLVVLLSIEGYRALGGAWTWTAPTGTR